MLTSEWMQLLQVAMPLVSSVATGLLVHIAHNTHVKAALQKPAFQQDLAQGLVHLGEAVTGKAVDAIPKLAADVVKIETDLRDKDATPAAPVPVSVSIGPVIT